MGIAAEGESLTVSAAWVWMSSSSEVDDGLWVVRVGEAFGGVGKGFWAMERTTSPLQIGHVRRRVVSQGVL